MIKMNMSIEVSRKLQKFAGNWFAFLGVVLCLTAFPAWAAETPETEKKDDEVVTQAQDNSETQVESTDSSAATKNTDNNDTPIEPSKEVIVGDSDEMDRDMKTGITILTGNVKTIRLNEQGVEIGFLNADKVTLKSDTETGQTVEIIAVGNVEIRDQEIFATCDHATMNNRTHIIVLKENVVVLQKEDRLETKLFTFNRLTGRQTGVGGVKFKVAVTQATPVSTSETSEEGGSDNKETTEEKKTPPATKEETKSDSEKPDSEEKTTPPDSEKKENKTETEEDKTSEVEEPEPSETEDTEPSETEEPDDEESPTEEQ